MLVISCDCGQRMKGPPSLLGKTVKCVRCGEQVAVTKRNTSPLSPPGAPEPQGAGPASGDKTTESTVKQAARHIGEILLDDGMLTADQVREAIAVQEREGGQILPIVLQLGYLDKLSLHDYLSRKPGIASIDLKSYYIPKELISLVPKEIAQECLVLPIDKLGRLLTVGMACPLDTDTVYRLEQITGLTVKPMLCKLDDILATIERYYPVEAPAPAKAASAAPPPERGEIDLDLEQEGPAARSASSAAESSAPPVPAVPAPVVPLRSELLERFARIDALPTFTDTVSRVKERLERGSATARDIIDIIAVDPPIVAKLLSTANAAPYGMPGDVSDTNLAAVLLGTDGVCEIAMLSVIAANQYDEPPVDFDRFMRRAQFGASAAFALAALADPSLRYQAYIGGLLHGIGSLALASAFPDRAAALSDEVTAFERISDETRLFGIGYPEAGGILADEWGIPKSIADAIRLHRDLHAAALAGPLASATGFAAILADAYIVEEAEPAHAIQEGEELLKVLGITARDALHVFNQVRAGMESGSRSSG